MRWKTCWPESSVLERRTGKLREQRLHNPRAIVEAARRCRRWRLVDDDGTQGAEVGADPARHVRRGRDDLRGALEGATA